MKFLTLKRRREQEPEVTHQTEPVTAYKAAQVVFNIRTGDVQLKGHRPGDISIEWVARIYQASFQEVTNLWFVRYCRLCANKGILTEATALRAYWDGQDVWTEVDEWYVLEPCCSAHSEVLVEKTFARTVSLSHITSKLQVEALWLPSETLPAERFLELITPA
jgi:hypothetical protein